MAADAKGLHRDFAEFYLNILIIISLLSVFFCTGQYPFNQRETVSSDLANMLFIWECCLKKLLNVSAIYH